MQKLCQGAHVWSFTLQNPPRDLVEHLMAETLSFPPMRGLMPQVKTLHCLASAWYVSQYWLVNIIGQHTNGFGD